MTTKQKRRILNVDIKVDTPTEEIGHIKCERLLGVCIQDDLKWSNYILHDEKSLIKQLSTRLQALRMISSAGSFKIRLMVANGIFCSKLIFQICLWGGTEEYLLNALQVVQNKAARFVTRRDRYTSVQDLIRQCGWISVKQLVFYHSVILIYKII